MQDMDTDICLNLEQYFMLQLTLNKDTIVLHTDS